MRHDDDALALLGALARGLDDDDRLILCGFAGDPDTADKTAWRPRAWRPGRELPFGRGENVYATVAAFGRAPDGTYRRRVDCFRAGLALMVDDVGTKVPREVVAGLPPTAIVETSAGNEQWWYALAHPERDVSTFDALIRAFIAKKLLGADPGMAGVNRVGRLPGFVNGKKKHAGFRTSLLELDPARRFTTAELVVAFDLDMQNGRRYRAESRLFVPETKRDRVDQFARVYARLKGLRALKAKEPDPSGWMEMRCPWRAEHTGKADTGAAIRLPSEENEWYGAFRCHHGHCADRGWRDLTDLLNEADSTAMDETYIPENA